MGKIMYKNHEYNGVSGTTYIDGLSNAIGITSSTITVKNGSSSGRSIYLETNSSDADDISLTAMIILLGWDSDVIVS